MEKLIFCLIYDYKMNTYFKIEVILILIKTNKNLNYVFKGLFYLFSTFDKKKKIVVC